MKPARTALAFLLLLLLADAAYSFGWRRKVTVPRTPCGSEFAAMDACLPAVAVRQSVEAPRKPSADCCWEFFSLLGGGTHCFCRLVREPYLDGMALNSSRLLSLFAACGGSISAGELMDACRAEARPVGGNSGWRIPDLEPPLVNIIVGVVRSELYETNLTLVAHRGFFWQQPIMRHREDVDDDHP